MFSLFSVDASLCPTSWLQPQGFIRLERLCSRESCCRCLMEHPACRNFVTSHWLNKLQLWICLPFPIFFLGTYPCSSGSPETRSSLPFSCFSIFLLSYKLFPSASTRGRTRLSVVDTFERITRKTGGCIRAPSSRLLSPTDNLPDTLLEQERYVVSAGRKGSTEAHLIGLKRNIHTHCAGKPAFVVASHLHTYTSFGLVLNISAFPPHHLEPNLRAAAILHWLSLPSKGSGRLC